MLHVSCMKLRDKNQHKTHIDQDFQPVGKRLQLGARVGISSTKSPTLMPWLPSQIRFLTTTLVELGLNETQSSWFVIFEFEMVTLSLR